MNSDHELSVGDVVLDSHQESADPAVVVNLPPKRANEWTAYTDTTVAEDNPEYPDDSEIAVVAFYGDLSERAEELLWPESPIPLNELHEYDVKDYAFPVDRLRPAEDTSLAARHEGEDQETTEANGETETTSDADERDEGDSEATRSAWSSRLSVSYRSISRRILSMSFDPLLCKRRPIGMVSRPLSFFEISLRQGKLTRV
jgi:hypothetical protein